MEVPFVDIFAGPGGLSEGFSRFASFSKSDLEFVSRLAIEKDEIAVETLRLRSFYRQFRVDPVPMSYYRVLQHEAPISSLHSLPEWKAAEEHVWQAELGLVDEKTLHEKLASKLADTPMWVLLGGPPCQAYSLMGRARMTGTGKEGRDASDDEAFDALKRKITDKFLEDKRHFLYQEYLRIVAVHQPNIFVMENVMGILSAVLPEKESSQTQEMLARPKRRRAFDQIKRDLADPWSALAADPKADVLAEFHTGVKHTYRLHSFVVAREMEDVEVADRDYLIKAELYGVPQKRHRVIILGIRDDVKAKPGVLTKTKATSVEDTIGDLPKLRSGLSRGDTDHEHWRTVIEETHNALFAGSKSPLSKQIIQLTHMDMDLGRGSPFVSIEAKTQQPQTDDLQNTPEPSKAGKLALTTWLHDPRLNGVLHHESRSHMPSDLVRYLYVASNTDRTGLSPKITNWPPELLPDHKNVSFEDKTKLVTSQGFNDRFKAQALGRPSSTVTSHIAKDGHFFIHPDPMQCRSLTVREAARLQTFPDNYFFCGNRTQRYHQIGNAVPPYLAVQLAEVVANLILKEVGDKESK